MTSPTTLHADTRRAVTAYSPADAGQAAQRDRVLRLLAAQPNACSRACAPAHVTAGAVVLDPSGRVLLTLHPKFGLWLQLGGHLEPGDANLAAAAAREAAEESGIPGLVPTGGIVDIDVHSVPCPAPGGAHHDLRYVFLAPAGAVAVRSAESLEVAWFDTFPDATDDSVRRAVAAARRCLASHPRPVGTPE